MAKSNKSKWIIGVTGTAFSAFVISQIGVDQMGIQNDQTVITKSMSDQEKEYVQLDWSNYVINGVTAFEGVGQSDRQTSRS